MKTQGRTFSLRGFVAANFLLIISLTGSSNGSDFPRFLYSPPPENATTYDSLEIIGTNLMWNYRYEWVNLNNYMNALGQHDIQAVLRGRTWPYPVQYYSEAQYMRYEVDLNYDEVLYDWNNNGTGYYFLNHPKGIIDENMPGSGASSWHLRVNGDTAGEAINGPRFTGGGENSAYLGEEWKPGMPESWPDTTNPYSVYKHRISVAADIDGVPPSALAFKLVLQYKYRYWEGSIAHIKDYDINSITITADSFDVSQQFKEFCLPAGPSVGDTAYKYWAWPNQDTTFVAAYCKLYWYDECDVWVDYFETMDMKRGYPFYASDSSHQEKLDSLADEAADLEAQYGNQIYAYVQSDTPRRISFTAHGDVNAALKAALPANSLDMTAIIH